MSSRFENNGMKIVIVIGIISIVSIIVSALAMVDSNNTSSGETTLKNQLNNLKNNTITPLKNQVGTLLTAQKNNEELIKMNKGAQGIQGPAGPTGGSFTEKGNLKNLGNGPNLSVDRLFGSGPNSKAYMDTTTFGKTSQRWTFNNDGTLENTYGGCLVGDKDGNNIHMSKNCKGNRFGQWNYDGQTGQVIWKRDSSRCLQVGGSIKSSMPTIKNGKPQNGTTQHTVLELGKCDPNLPKKQLWIFS